MAVSLRLTGTWAELTADGSVAIPATPQAGDRMYLFARWKDFSITATVANWTELAEFADGAVGSGNGTGSVKVGCWYRDWQSGDSDPTIDFSASPTNASVVIIVMAKDEPDSWLTPVAVTAAMTNWTNTSQTVSASSTTNVLGDGVVMGLIGIRDDTTVMTRPTNGIDDAGGLVTWNGNYVEAPATHHSTTTGDDGAADLGYRLVTTGASGVTLRMTGTISATETGAALWVVQGVQVTLTVDNSAHLQSATNLALTQVHALTVANDSHAHSAESLALTQVHETVIQGGQHAHAVDSLVLTQTHVLDTQNASHDHSAGNVTIEVIHHLAIQGTDHACLSDNLTLEITHHLEADNSTHAHAAENVTLAQVHELLIDNVTHAHTAESPNARTFLPVFIDPGGDAVQAVGYFNLEPPGSTGDVTFDNTEWVVGVGSYKFDSGVSGLPAYLRAPGVLGVARRVSAYFWYDSLPDVVQSIVEFVPGAAVDYSGGGFAGDSNFQLDDGTYATATPAQNSGQGSVFSSPAIIIPPDATIVSVKIIYERKYDVNTSIGISRVKWRVNGEEGPDHDNTDMPLTDTVVEVDVTNDQFWEPQHLTQTAFEVIAEARRGDTTVEHTQSWDYVKVEVQYRPATTIMAAYEGEDIAFSLVLVPKGDHGIVRFTEGLGPGGSKFSYDGITKLLPDVKNRISFGYVVNGLNDLDIKVYVNSVEELSIEGSATNGWLGAEADLYSGWIHTPGVDHVCWIDQLYIDDGDDLTDCGNVRCTAKLPATVNENNWNTTGGTGAVNERPLSETNFRQETRASQFRQTYTLQDAATGDVDLTGKTLVGYMGWAWAKRGAGTNEDIALVVNGVQSQLLQGVTATNITTTPKLVYLCTASATYPSDAAGIGMASNNEIADTFMYECGAIVAYLPAVVNPNLLMAHQVLEEDSITNLTDDLRSDPQESYELCYRIDEGAASVLITIYSILNEGQPAQLQGICGGQGGYGRTRITPGVEVQVVLEVTGGSAGVSVWRRVDIA